MVNTGRPSMACQRCRNLKTKCCETKPTCTRCARKGVPCVYSTASRFKSMNSWSETTVQTRISRKMCAYTVSDLFPCDSQIPLNWFDEALGPFFDRYIVQPDALESTFGFMAYLPLLYAESDPDSHLAHAVKACALANLGNAGKIPTLATAAFRSYGKCLKSLCNSMDRPESAAKEGALTSMMLLALYESISGTVPPDELFHAHHRGQALLIRLEGSRPELSEMNRSIAAHTNRHILCRDMAERRGITYGLRDWAPGLYRSWLDESVARFNVDVIDGCGEVRRLQAVAVQDRDQIWKDAVLGAAQQLAQLDSEALRCQRDAPTEWKARSLPADWTAESAIRDSFPTYSLSNLYSTVKKTPFTNIPAPHVDREPVTNHCSTYNPRCDVYATRPVANIWNWMRSARLHLLRTMIDVSYLIEESRLPSPVSDLETLRQQISDTVHDMCGSVHYLLGDVDVNLDGEVVCRAPDRLNIASGYGVTMQNVLFTLHKICALPGTKQSIYAFALSICERIGTTGHVRQGLKLKRFYTIAD